jgi:hypothetical protein
MPAKFALLQALERKRSRVRSEHACDSEAEMCAPCGVVASDLTQVDQHVLLGKALDPVIHNADRTETMG